MKRLTRALISTCLVASTLSTATYAAGELQAELKVPTGVTMTENQLEVAKKAKRAAAERAKLHKEMGTLSRDYKGKEQLMAELSKKMQEQQVVVMNALKSAQGIHMELILKNTGKTDITTSLGGDVSTLMIELTGPEAVNLPYGGPMTRELRSGKPVTIKAGGTHTIAIPELRYGSRNMSGWMIGAWGRYKVDVSLRCIIEGKPVTIKASPAHFFAMPDNAVLSPASSTVVPDKKGSM